MWHITMETSRDGTFKSIPLFYDWICQRPVLIKTQTWSVPQFSLKYQYYVMRMYAMRKRRERNKVAMGISMLAHSSTLSRLKMMRLCQIASHDLTKCYYTLVWQKAHWGTSELFFVSSELHSNPQPLQINQNYK